jgi:hypothetical protein
MQNSGTKQTFNKNLLPKLEKLLFKDRLKEKALARIKRCIIT